MIRPGKMLRQVIAVAFKKPATEQYPYKKYEKPEGFRGKLKFYPEKCIGCKMCMRDCPSGAITIRKIGDKGFEAELDLRKCVYCGQCVDSCPKKALQITKEFELAQLKKEKLRIVYPCKDAPQTDPPKKP